MSDAFFGLAVGFSMLLAIVAVVFVCGSLWELLRPRRTPAAAPICPVCERDPVDAAWSPTCSRQCWRWLAWVKKFQEERGGTARSTWDA